MIRLVDIAMVMQQPLPRALLTLAVDGASKNYWV